MAALVRCGSCGRLVPLPDGVAGTAVSCPECGATFQAPAEGAFAPGSGAGLLAGLDPNSIFAAFDPVASPPAVSGESSDPPVEMVAPGEDIPGLTGSAIDEEPIEGGSQPHWSNETQPAEEPAPVDCTPYRPRPLVEATGMDVDGDEEDEEEGLPDPARVFGSDDADVIQRPGGDVVPAAKPASPLPRIKIIRDEPRSRVMPVVVALVVGLGIGIGFMFWQQNRSPAVSWEVQNKARLMTLAKEAEAVERSGDQRSALARYDALLTLFDGQTPSDPEVMAIFDRVREARLALLNPQGKGREVRTSVKPPTSAPAVGNALATSPATRTVIAPPLPPISSPVVPPPVTQVATTVPATTIPTTRPVEVVVTPPVPAPPTTAPTATPTTAPATQQVAVAATRPAVPMDEETRERESLRELLQQAANALAAGESPLAMDHLSDARSLFDKKLRARGLTMTSPEYIAIMQSTAVAHLLMGRPERAGPLFEAGNVLDRACSAKTASRQLLLARGMVDAQQGLLAMRTVTRLGEFLKDNPSEVDSETLDVLFSALQKANERARPEAIEPHIKNYERLNAQVEAQRKGQKRFGVRWVSTDDFTIQMMKRRAAVEAATAAASRAEQLARAAEAAERRLEAARSRDRATINSASNDLNAARTAKFNATKAAAEAKAKIPAIPVLTKEDARRILIPRETVIASADKPTASGNTAIASATGTGSDPLVTSKPPTTGTTSTTRPTLSSEKPVNRRFSRASTGFAVGPDLILTTSMSIADAKRVMIEFPDGQQLFGVVERTGKEGLALLRVQGQQWPYFNFAPKFLAGPVLCPSFPEVSVFGARLVMARGQASFGGLGTWTASLDRHPRLPGSPLLDNTRNVVGMEFADRDSRPEAIPAMPLERLKDFLGANLPERPCQNPEKAPVVQVTALFER